MHHNVQLDSVHRGLAAVAQDKPTVDVKWTTSYFFGGKKGMTV